MANPAVDHDDIQELLGAYALDAVDPDEAELVGRHLEVCPRCRAEVREHREVAGLLGYGGQDAPPGLWDRITASMQEAPPALRLDQLPTGGHRAAPAGWTRLGRRATAVLAVAAAVVIAVLGVQVARLDHRTTTLGNEMASAAPSMHAVQVALSVPGARKVSLSPVSSGASVDAVVLPGGQGYLYNTALAPLPAAQTYQLWGIAGGRAISYGILGSTPAQVVSFRAATGVQALAITEEAAGGAEQPLHAPIASGAVNPTL